VSAPKIEGEMILRVEASPEEFAAYNADETGWTSGWGEPLSSEEAAGLDAVELTWDEFEQNIDDKWQLWTTCRILVEEAAAELKAQASEPYRASSPPGASR
jgi:hypothetical protein